jgi:histidine triad (HIT) family protein
MMASVFTRIVSGELPSQVIWQDADFAAILDIHPINPGHVLLIPKLEIESVFDLPAPIYQRAWEIVRWLEPTILRVTGAPKLGIAVEGFGVAHAHIHLVPVFEGNQLDPNRAKAASQTELSQMYSSIVQALEMDTPETDPLETLHPPETRP